MYPANIQEYAKPESIKEIFEIVGRYDEGESLILAGGQSAMQAIKSRMLRPQCIIDLQAIKELKEIEDGPTELKIGAMVRYRTLATSQFLNHTFTGLKDAASHVGDRQVRNRGTIGGSVCWNYAAACTPSAVLALNGTMHLLSSNGQEKTIAADDFFLGPLDTAKTESDILLAVSLPRSIEASGSAYKKWGLIKDALPVVGLCAFIKIDKQGRCCAARIALTGMGNGAQRAFEGEKALLSSDGDTASIIAVTESICDSTNAPSDMWASAEYRYQLIRSLGLEVIQKAFDRARS